MSEQLRCPEKACAGWVCKVEELKDVFFFGCGECGNVWRSEQDIASAIENAVDRYPYRARAYAMSGDSWKDKPSGSMASDYEQNVALEWGQ
jgi:hypothetical protein